MRFLYRRGSEVRALEAAVAILCLGAAAVAAAQVAREPAPDEFLITAEHVEAQETPDGRILFLEGNVTIDRAGGRLVGRHGVYRDWLGSAIIHGDVRGVDEESEIACDTLKYFRDVDLAVLIGDAAYSDSSGTTTADRIEVHRPEEIANCIGGARAEAADGSSELIAPRILYDLERREVRASGGAVLTTYDEDGELDATLSGRVVEISPELDAVRAFGDAEIVREDVVARARSATIDGERDLIVLAGDPAVEQAGDRLSGETIIVFAADGAVSRIVSVGDARVDYWIEDEFGQPDERGQVGGDTLTMFLEEGEPTFTVSRGGASSEHFVGASGERNLVESASIDIFFHEGRISRATFRGGASGVYDFVPEGADSTVAEEASGDSVSLDTVAYSSQQIDYYVARNRIVLRGRARVEYQTTILTAGSVVFDPDTEVLSAEGHPDLREKSDRLVGESLSYDLEGRAGVINEGVTTFEDGLYYGETIARESDGALRVSGGTYTTCSAAEPHYRLVSHKMKIYMNDKVIARPVILYVGEVPVFALPFYVFPIRKDRHSGFLIPSIEVGLSEGKGRFVKNFGYYWAPNDYFDVSVWGDYYEFTKWIAHLETRYKLRYSLSGSVKTSFMEEMTYNKRRWDLEAQHRQELGANWTASLSADFRSDATYASDTNQSIEESVDRSLHSQLWMNGRWSGLSAGVTVDRREELDDGTVSELLPKVQITASQRPLVRDVEGSSGLRALLSRVSYSWNAVAVNDRDRGSGDVESHQGLGVGATLRAPGKVLGWLNLTPRLSLDQDWYDRDRRDREFPGRFTYTTAVSAGTTVYGTFFPEVGRLEAVRHVIEPSISYSWTPEFSEYFDEGSDVFHTFSGFGSTPRAKKAVGVSLVNKLQLKVRRGEKTQTLDNLLRWSASSSYDFKKDEHRWADVSSSVEFRPGKLASVRWSSRYDAYDWTLESSSVTTTLSLRGSTPEWEGGPLERELVGHDSPVDDLRRTFSEEAGGEPLGVRPWDAGVTFRYSRGADPDDATYWFDGSVDFSPTPRWRLNYRVHYDLREQEVASQEWAVHRDLHCWEAQFVRRYYDGEWQYYFRINVKALPEIQAESGRTYLQRSVR